MGKLRLNCSTFM